MLYYTFVYIVQCLEWGVNMGKLIGCCGILCSECEAYTATISNDFEKMKKLSEKWSTEEYKIEPEEITCYGCCTENNKKFKFCSECEIRLCVVEKDVKNCAFCSEYPCKKLEKPFDISPENKERLDELKFGVES